MASKTFISKNPATTRKIARILGRELASTKLTTRHALCVALSGDLGTGKTAFAQGLAAGLGHRGRVHSPTFVLMKRYPIRASRFNNLWHVDCYRIGSPSELLTLGFKKILGNPQNILVIEWPEKIKKYIPAPAIRILFDHHSPTTRVLKIVL